jgi:[ribosomal protein S5]-alanine N-acetyltransferase
VESGRFDLSTDRLSLVPLTRAQTERAHTLWTNAEMRQFLWHDEIIDRKEAVATLQRSEADFEQAGYGLWGVYLKGHDDLIGFCGLRSREHGGAPEMLVGLLPAYWGLGFVSEAASAVLRYAFDDAGVDSVHGSTLVSNVAATRALEHIGAEFLGREQSEHGETVVYLIAPARFRARSGKMTE